MKDILWKPISPEKTQMSRLIQIVNESYSENIDSYDQLHQWSIDNIHEFWGEIWDYTKIVHSSNYNKVVDNVTKMPGAKWFPGARLNFAENLLRYKDSRPAIHFKGEGKPIITLSYHEIYNEVEKLRVRDKQTLPRTWKDNVRGRIEEHSKVVDGYIPGNPDLFYPAEGKGKGIWALTHNYKTQMYLRQNQVLPQLVYKYLGQRHVHHQVIRSRYHYILQTVML